MQEQTAELKLHWWFEFIRLKKMGNDDKDGDGSATSKRQHLTNTLHFEQTELTHFMLSAAAEPLCTTVRKKICFCPGHTDSNSTRSLAGSWTHSCKIFHSSIPGKGVDSGLMSEWQQHNSADLQWSYSWFTPVQGRVPACSHSPSLVCFSQLWFFMTNNKKILLRAQLLRAWCTEQNCKFRSPGASCRKVWDVLPVSPEPGAQHRAGLHSWWLPLLWWFWAIQFCSEGNTYQWAGRRIFHTLLTLMSGHILHLVLICLLCCNI